jgi:simple sugar transport system substrate-binding protein
VIAEAEALRDAIAAGTYHPYTGPIKKQDGSDWLAEGAVAPDGDLLGMNFYVEGIVGDIPQ